MVLNETGRRKSCRDFVKGMIRNMNAMNGDMNWRAVYGNSSFAKRLTGIYNISEIVICAERPRTKNNN
jgi:hypothetical protein